MGELMRSSFSARKVFSSRKLPNKIVDPINLNPS